MRILVLVFLAGAAIAQAPSSFKPKPFGNLKQVMRGILRPNSDIIFNVQATPPKNDMEWNGIENAAVALEEAANLITLPGRLREDGQPVPAQRANWNKWAQGVLDAGQACYKAAQAKSADKVNDCTDKLAESCSNCHDVYRDRPQGK
jgi:cytochrome c556